MRKLTLPLITFTRIGFMALMGVTLLLGACGGGGGSSASSSGNNSSGSSGEITVETVYTGIFIDSVVEGLRYAGASLSGETNATGSFQYKLGEPIVFSIGGIQLPPVTGKQYITPLDIFQVTSLSDTAALNLTRFLQTLDTDGNLSNGIHIADFAHEMSADITLDFSAVNFDSQVESLITNLGGANTSLVSGADALAHFQQSLNEIPELRSCETNHAKVGYEGNFSTLAHQVSGRARVIDDCTIEITMFNYDGLGPLVYFYAGIDNNYIPSTSFTIGNSINGRSYTDAAITLRLPIDKTLDDFNSLSVWCADFRISFGELLFSAP